MKIGSHAVGKKRVVRRARSATGQERRNMIAAFSLPFSALEIILSSEDSVGLCSIGRIHTFRGA
jgi:hypothetical protein